MSKNKDFPREFDLYFDCKSPGECYRELSRLKDSVMNNADKYQNLHRMMREHGISTAGWPEAIDRTY